MGSRLKEKLKFCLGAEVVIEYKACLYFCCILAFDCFYFLYRKFYFISILHLFEMIMAAYFAGYFQVYVLHNFDEAEKINFQSVSGAVLCTGFYTGISYLFGWFERNLAAEILFTVYMLLVYLCIYIIHKIKRAIDTEKLNGLLMEFKKGAGENDENRKCN